MLVFLSRHSLWAQDTVTISKGHLQNYSPKLSNKNYYVLENSDFEFNGYLVIKFDSYFSKLLPIDFEIFWIDSLQSINSYDSRFYYNFIDDFFRNYFMPKPEKAEGKFSENSDGLKTFFKNYFILNDRTKNSFTYLYGVKNNNIKGELFQNKDSLYTDGLNYYLMFETKFRAGLLKSAVDQGLMYNKVIIPVSDVQNFKEVQNSYILEKMGWMKKKIVIKMHN